jgi:hypothetical protein
MYTAVIAGKNLYMSPLSKIQNNGEGRVVLAVDHHHPKRPRVGDGALIMEKGAEIIGQDLIQIFTAKQELNQIDGTIRGKSFSQGPRFISESPEMWSVYFGSEFFHEDSPYTIYYKNGILTAKNIERAQLLTSEMLTSFHSADEYLGWPLEFQLATDHPQKSHSKVNSDELCYLRMKNLNVNSPKNALFITYPKPLNAGNE